MMVLLTTAVALADPPSADDLARLWKQGDFASVVSGCDADLGPDGLTDAQQRYSTAWLKGEAELRLMQADAAVAAFNAAAKETHDSRQQSIATATAILIGRSKDFVYTSATIKPPTQQPVVAKPLATLTPGADATTKPLVKRPAVLPRGQFDIIDPAHRAEAMDAMWVDERVDAESTIKAKVAAKTLAAVNEALERVHQAEPIAVAGGAPEWSQTQKDRLANAAKVSVNTEIVTMNMQLVAIVKDQVKRRNKPHPTPMPQSTRDQINQMTLALDEAQETLKALPEQLNVEKDTFDLQIQRASELEDHATTVLATD
jgi:hypothetical protein